MRKSTLILTFVYISLELSINNALVSDNHLSGLCFMGYLALVWGIWLPTSGRALYRMIVS